MSEFLRFEAVQDIRHPKSGEPYGLFQAAGRLREAGELTEIEQEWLESVTAWFNENLSRPRRFSRKHRAERTALSWFRATAAEHIRRMRDLATVLREHGVATRVRRTTKPGYVIYEDDHQVVAVPFRGSGA